MHYVNTWSNFKFYGLPVSKHLVLLAICVRHGGGGCLQSLIACGKGCQQVHSFFHPSSVLDICPHLGREGNPMFPLPSPGWSGAWNKSRLLEKEKNYSLYHYLERIEPWPTRERVAHTSQHLFYQFIILWCIPSQSDNLSRRDISLENTLSSSKALNPIEEVSNIC